MGSLWEAMGRSLVRLNGSGAAWVAGMGNGGATRRRPLRKGLDTPRGGYMLWSATGRRSLITANGQFVPLARRSWHPWILGYR